MIQKLISALILVPLAILFVVFAVANRQTVVVSFDPFDAAEQTVFVAIAAAFADDLQHGNVTAAS